MKLLLLPAAVEGTTTLGYPAFVILPLGIVQAICLADCGCVTGGSLTDALRDQLGLRLNRTETPTTFVVIDSAEKPTPN